MTDLFHPDAQKVAADVAVDVAIVGGGVIGTAIGWRAAQRGMSVAILDPTSPAGPTSLGPAWWAAAGLLAPVTEVEYGEEALLGLTMESARRYPAFIAELEAVTDMSTGYRRTGTLLVARDSDDKAALSDLAAFQTSLGLEIAPLTSRECRRLEPALAPTTRGGILVAGDHQVDNRALLAALRVAATRARAVVVAQRGVRIRTAGDRATGVVCADGTVIAAGQVVVAAGCWSGDLDGLPPDLLPPVRPVKGQLLHLRESAGIPLINRNVRGLDVYLVPRADGRLVVGATVEERGRDVSATAGGVHELLRAAYELVPGITECELTEIVVGLRPGSPDNAPLLGHLGMDGLIMATGHYRNGILLTPVTADAIATLLGGAGVPDEIAAFSPRRFAPAGATT